MLGLTFEQVDTNGDGLVTREEYHAAMAAAGRARARDAGSESEALTKALAKQEQDAAQRTADRDRALGASDLETESLRATLTPRELPLTPATEDGSRRQQQLEASRVRLEQLLAAQKATQAALELETRRLSRLEQGQVRDLDQSMVNEDEGEKAEEQKVLQAAEWAAAEIARRLGDTGQAIDVDAIVLRIKQDMAAHASATSTGIGTSTK